MAQLVYNNQLLTTYKLASPTVAFKTMTESLISTPFPLTNTYTFIMEFIWTGTPTGTLKIMGSIDGTNFNVPLATNALTGSAGTYPFDLSATPGLITNVGWIQAQYIFTSGTGTLTTVTAASKYNPLLS